MGQAGLRWRSTSPFFEWGLDCDDEIGAGIPCANCAIFAARSQRENRVNVLRLKNSGGVRFCSSRRVSVVSITSSSIVPTMKNVASSGATAAASFSALPAYKAKLSADEIQALVTLIRHLKK